MIRVKSTSSEGIYYLVNGWERNRAFWIDEDDVKTGRRNCVYFKNLASAKRSLTMLLKIMPDYLDDVIEYETIEEDGK